MESGSKYYLKFAILSLLVLIALCSFFTGLSPVRGDDEASAKIVEADNAVQQAYGAVLDAEESGANVSSLIAKLEDAGLLLAEAETAYRSGNSTEAFAKAEDSLMIVAGVKDEASSMKDSALADVQKAFVQTLLFSVVGGVAFVGFMVFVWIRFKRGYTRKLLKMKPEVAADAA